ncbi:MAG TPA: hypothetical protein PKD24_12080 [Pyrinomonadaceae bacterium]|nr:hypothetical protein [Pyrinomonadaceae bacterium]HMP65987.1 hypothetical protein [Pyrinomonadaceae bacterium]
MDAPVFDGNLRKNIVRVPDVISEASGITILGRTLRSFIFSTDVAIIRNTNADAIMAVYPFTPQPIISHALILASDKPVFCGIGGGTTAGQRCVEIGIDAEFQGALGVVLNQPTKNELITRVKSVLEIPIIVTVVSTEENIRERIGAGVDIFNVSGAAETPKIVRKIRELAPSFPIIATGGRSDDTIREVIELGANAVSYTPPSTSELFRPLMSKYRDVAP